MDAAHAAAATVVLLREGAAGPEVLLLERPADHGSFRGAWVFPGGRVEPEDALSADGTPRDEEYAARAAAVRETFEETGLILDRDSLVTSSRWTPPPGIPRRYVTWFYVALAPRGDVVLSPQESVGYRWLRPADALELHASGRLNLVPPTWVTLHGLTGDASASDAIERARQESPSDYATHLATSANGPVLLWQGDVAYADESLVDRDGARHRLETAVLPWVYRRD